RAWIRFVEFGNDHIFRLQIPLIGQADIDAVISTFHRLKREVEEAAEHSTFLSDVLGKNLVTWISQAFHFIRYLV
ncbi:hypothetical protein PENTCL1PPCAC_13480, partial [Pristionchus entomophagus]